MPVQFKITSFLIDFFLFTVVLFTDIYVEIKENCLDILLVITKFEELNLFVAMIYKKQ